MSDIFISYAREDWAFANLLAEELRLRGYDVWWDKDLVAGEAGFREVLQQKLDEVKALVVIWSVDSANSQWVREEAMHAKHYGKLIATRLPGMDYMQIPLGFREDQTETVTDLEKIEKGLRAKKIIPQPTDGSPESDARYMDQLAKLLDTQEKQESGSLSSVLPLLTLLGGMVLGMSTLIASVLIGAGWVQWEPTNPPPSPQWIGPKQVGYIPAINWSLTTVIILPMAWALILLARQSIQSLRSIMVSRRMVVSQDFDPIVEDDERIVRMWGAVRKVTVGCIITITSLLVIFSLLDYYSVVDRVYQDPAVAQKLNSTGPDGYALTHVTMERDWSLAALLNRTDHTTTAPWLNRSFTLFVYVVFAGFGVGGLFSFFVALFGVGMFFMPDVSRRFGLLIIPDLSSNDHRRGFEIFGQFFSLTLSIASICLVMTYLMSLQNIYLRVPATNLFAFLAPHPDLASAALARGDVSGAVDAWVGLITCVPGDSLQSLIAWCIASFMVVSILGVAYLFLRASALQGRVRILSELKRLGTARLRRITKMDGAEIESRLTGMRTWPLLWPNLNATIIATFLILVAFVFYKLGILVMLCALGFVVYNTFQLFQR